MKKKVLVEVSSRHVHLTRKDVETLFGKGSKLTILKKLSQRDNFSAKETVDIINRNNSLGNVRVLGPERNETQVELSRSDAINLGIDAPLRLSGDLSNTPGIVLKGPKGEVNLTKGVIVAKRHIHLNPKQADELGIKENDVLSVKIGGERELCFHEIIVRVNKDFSTSVHLDTDEGNAAGIMGATYGEIL